MNVYEYAPSLRSRWDYVFVLCVSLVVVDGLMTLPFWHLEGNPLVLALGPAGMMGVKIGGVSALSAVWFSIDGVRTSRVVHTLVGMLTALYAVVVLSNLGYLVLA